MSHATRRPTIKITVPREHLTYRKRRLSLIGLDMARYFKKLSPELLEVDIGSDGHREEHFEKIDHSDIFQLESDPQSGAIIISFFEEPDINNLQKALHAIIKPEFYDQYDLSKLMTRKRLF